MESPSTSPIKTAPKMPQCEYRLIKSKRKGEQCKRSSSKEYNGRNYCVYHFRMVSTKTLEEPIQPTPTENKQALHVSQLRFPEEELVKENEPKKKQKIKREKPMYNEQTKPTSSHRLPYNDEYKLDYDSLEKWLMESFHSNYNS